MSVPSVQTERVPGAVYATTPVAMLGAPLAQLLIDPPIAIDADAADLPVLGMALVPRQDGSGAHDLWEIVDDDTYPNVADFIERVLRSGISRLVSGLEGIDWSLLTKDSRIVFLHRRAVISNFAAFHRRYDEESAAYLGLHGRGWRGCPTGRHREGETPAQCCAGLWWETVAGGDFDFDPTHPPRSVVRAIGADTYSAREGFSDWQPDFTLGAFMVAPIARLVVIQDHENARHRDAYERIRPTTLSVSIEQH